MGMIAIILLIGIVKKNGIILVDFAIAAERDRGMTAIEAIRLACLQRFRPTMMTTAAAMVAGVPLALGPGTGSELRQPLGYAIAICASPHGLDYGELANPGKWCILVAPQLCDARPKS